MTPSEVVDLLLEPRPSGCKLCIVCGSSRAGCHHKIAELQPVNQALLARAFRDHPDEAHAAVGRALDGARRCPNRFFHLLMHWLAVR